jgi:Tol biopolymer transport system component
MVANEDGSNQKVVLAAGPFISYSRPSWSPDGTALVFESNIEGDGIYTVGIDGTGLTKIASLNSGSSTPIWSPVPAADGEYKIAFWDLPRNEDGSLGPKTDIFLVNLDGSGLQNLTNTPDVYEAFGTWAPSATRLAVWSIGTEDALQDILVLDIGVGIDGLEVTAELNLTSEADVPGGLLNDVWVDLPSWAKTQDKIVVRVRAAPEVNDGSDLSDLWIIDLADPANPTNLTETPETGETHPSWSTDDAHVVFHLGVGGLYVLPTDGTGSASQIVSRGGHADWRR